MVETGALKVRDWIAPEIECTREEWETVLDCASQIKQSYARGEAPKLLDRKTLFMLFYNRSLRTRNSFEVGMTQLGGHAINLTPTEIYTPALAGEEIPYTTERVSDVARVLSGMGDAIGIRIYGKPTNWLYGKGESYIREFAKWASIPVINMEDDVFHPCQLAADLLTLKEFLGDNLKGKKFVMSWAYSGSAEKPLAIPQSAVLGTTLFGMDVILAHPKGFELDPIVIDKAKEYADLYGGSFEISNNMKEAFEGADAVYPKSWGSLICLPPKVKQPDFSKMKEFFERGKSWICNQEKMDLTNRAIYMHCLPADRGMEVMDKVIDGKNSVVWQEAWNRLHAQKSILSLLLR
jgi:N-acetylornithine carbamoyltransferase